MPDVTETAELVYLDDAESALAEPDSSSTKMSRQVILQFRFPIRCSVIMYIKLAVSVVGLKRYPYWFWL